MSGYIPVKEQKKLHTKSGNRCAICKTVLVDVKNVTSACIGENAHIYGEKPGAARYDATKNKKFVNSEENLIFLCCNCHTKIDNEEKDYPTEKLFEIKKQHECAVTEENASLPVKKQYPSLDKIIKREVVPFDDFRKGETHLFFHNELRSSLFAACVKSKRVVLLGEAGCGKSFALKQLAAEISADENNNLFPVLYDLRLYTTEEIETIIESEYPQINKDKVFLILDAYDEIEEQDQNRFARKLSSFAKKYPNTFIVISTRNNFYTCADKDGYGAKFENFTEYSLCSLTSKQIEQYVIDNGLSWELFCKEIYIRKINDLISNPFYLVELVKLLLTDKKLPEKSELMEKIILSRFSKDIKKYTTTKNIHANQREIMINLQKVAFAMQCMHKIEITEDDYQQLLGLEERKLLNYSGIFSKVENDKHRFEHNNFREYLTAKYLCQLDFESIQQLLCTSDGVIKDSWVNVLSYLVLIYDNPDLLSWLCEVGPEFVVKFERTRLSEDDRNRITRSLIDSISNRNMWISRTNISADELARFGESPNTCEYLLKQIQNPVNFRSQSNAIQVLSNFSQKYNMDEAIKDTLFSCIKSSKTRNYEKREAIEAIVELGLATHTITEYLLSKYEQNDSNEVAYGIINYLISLPNNEDYIDIFIKEYDECGHPNKDYSSNTYLRIKEFFEKSQEYNVLCKLLTYFSQCEEHHSLDKELFENLIAKATSEYMSGNKNIFEVILKAIVTTERKYNSLFREYCKKFFKDTNTLKDAFITLASQYTEGDWDLLFLLESIDDTDCYKALLDDAEKHIDLISHLYVRMQENHPLLSNYEDALKNAGREIPKRRKFIDYSAERQKGIQLYFDSLFNKEIFSVLINSLLEYAENPDLTYSELQEIHRRDFEDISKGEILFQLSIDLDNYEYKSQKVKKFVSEIYWEGFSMRTIYRLLEGDNKINVSEEQVYYIEKLCKDNIETIEQWDPNSKKITWSMVYIIFLSAHFDFTYPKSIFLKMLFIPKFYYRNSDYSHNSAFSSYVTKHLTDNDIKTWISTNAKPNKLLQEVAEDCMTFCQHNKLNSTIELAEDFLENSDSEWLKRKSVEYIIEICGYKYLYDKYLYNCDDIVLKCIVECTINHRDPQLIEKLEEINRNSTDPLTYLSQLVFLKSSYGLEKYYELAKENMTLPDFSSKNGISPITEKISEISEVEHIPILSKLQSLLFLPGFVDKDAFGLWNSLHNAFRKIAHNDYNEVKKHLEDSLQHCDSSDEERCFCNSILEEILRDQNTAKDIAWSMDEVIGFLNHQ